MFAVMKIFVTDISVLLEEMILYLIYGFGMVTCTMSPLSRFTAHLLPVYSATFSQFIMICAELDVSD
jgi:hypothetical protein